VKSFARTDLGNAERFTAQHGDRVRHVSQWSAWFVWDGKRWARDADREVWRLATSTVRSIYREAANAGTDDDRKALAAHAAQSESAGRMTAMLDLARHMKPIASVPGMFDSPETTYLLNVLNGTLNLTTGELQPHRRADYITKLAPVMFDSEARSALWDSFLERQVPDPEVRAFLQRAAGYALTGDTSEEKLLFVHGPEASGKSTFTEALKATLGEYAATTDFETFLRKRGDAGIRNDIARLAGVRMVLSLEVDEGRHLAEALLKNLVGGDTISARHLYQSFFEYKPAFKLWLVANHRPQANAEDGALWRRIVLVPFTVSIPEDERDPAVKATLTADPGVRSAILTWAAQGCREWQRIRLRPPDGVRAATAAYRENCDHVGAFLDDCFSEPPEKITAADLHQRYKTWCEANGEKPLPANRVGEALKRRGLAQSKTGGTRSWRWPGPIGTAGTARTALSDNSPRARAYGEFPDSAVRAVPAVPDPEGSPDE
jgi:putative DNA primase/helicase